MATTESRTTVSAHRVNLVDKNNTGGLLLCLFEHVAYARRAYAHKHLDKVRARNREERHFGFTCNRFREQRLTGTGLTDHQDTARYSAAQFLEPTRIPEKLNQLLDIFLGLVNARNVGEGCCDLVLTQEFGFALTKAHGATAAARTPLHLAHKKHEDRDDDKNRETGD